MHWVLPYGLQKVRQDYRNGTFYLKSMSLYDEKPDLYHYTNF